MDFLSLWERIEVRAYFAYTGTLPFRISGGRVTVTAGDLVFSLQLE
jgi:hypothetical protein